MGSHEVVKYVGKECEYYVDGVKQENIKNSNNDILTQLENQILGMELEFKMNIKAIKQVIKKLK